jgi:hypothetical protein
MVSFAFNTMIGQVTPIAMESIGWRDEEQVEAPAGDEEASFGRDELSVHECSVSLRLMENGCTIFGTGWLTIVRAACSCRR